MKAQGGDVTLKEARSYMPGEGDASIKDMKQFALEKGFKIVSAGNFLSNPRSARDQVRRDKDKQADIASRRRARPVRIGYATAERARFGRAQCERVPGGRYASKS